jgi:SnoaL-like domain
MVEHKRVPNLEELDGREAYSFLTDVFFYGPIPDPEVVYEANHPDDYVIEMPQSGERFRGRENMRAIQRARGNQANPPRYLQLRRVLVKEGLWVVEAVIDYGDGRVFDVVLILELRDGKMWRDRWYFAEPFEAPEWRSQWVKRMES